MHLINMIVLGLITGVLVVLVSAAEIPTPDGGLKCWVCSSKLDSHCGVEEFNGETAPSILKENCSQVPSPSRFDPRGVTRTVSATGCWITILKSNEMVTVSRGCASPGDVGIDDAESTECITKVTSNGSGSSETCVCKGDYCNAADTLKSTVFMAITLFGLIFIR